MTAFHETFLPIFLVGAGIALVVSFFAGRLKSWLATGVLLAFGVVAFWASLFVGSDMGYRAWQSIPDPPPQAFADTAPLGALVFGWIPGGLFCLVIYGISRGIASLSYARRGELYATGSDFSDSGNPYNPLTEGRADADSR